jgi:hypothetical protein
MPKTFIFWKYDEFPYVKWAELDRVEAGNFHLKGYQGRYVTFKSILGVLSEFSANEMIQRILKLEALYKGSKSSFINEAARLSQELGEF